MMVHITQSQSRGQVGVDPSLRGMTEKDGLDKLALGYGSYVNVRFQPDENSFHLRTDPI